MTFKELKNEAKNQGYKLIKIKPPVKFLPCICGNNRREWWLHASSKRRSVVCCKCGLRSPWVIGNDDVVKTAWNNMILELKQKAENSN